MRSISFNHNVKLLIYSDLNCLKDDVADLFVKEFNKGLCVVSGGATPKKIYKEISKKNNFKPKRKILLADDRLVSNNSVLSNYSMILKNLLIDFEENFPLSYYNELQTFSVKSLQKKIKEILKENKLHTSFLGIGADGHTASLFTEKADFNSKSNSFKIKNNFDDFERFTLSYKSLMMSKQIVFIATGSEKNKPLLNFFSNKIDFNKFPFQKLASDHINVKFYCDEDAVKNIKL
mgnify:CR=1 FL=1